MTRKKEPSGNNSGADKQALVDNSGRHGSRKRTSPKKETPLPEFTVNDKDRTLWDFLGKLCTDPNAALALSEWLEECSDPRAGSVHELATVECVLQPVTSESNQVYSMGHGSWFEIRYDHHEVIGLALPGSWQYRHCNATSHCVGVSGDLLDLLLECDTPEEQRKKFDNCRRRLICLLFATRVELVEAREACLTEPMGERVELVLLNWDPKYTVRWVRELQASNRKRFVEVVRYILSEPACGGLLYGLLDAIRPNWSEKILALLDTGNQDSPEPKE